MENKKIIMGIELDSKEFEAKVLVSLEKADGINTTLLNLSDRQKEIDNFLFLLMNTKSSQRKYCKTCNGYHWIFVNSFEPKGEENRSCLCSHCGNMLVLLTLFKAKKEDIIEWLKSEGKINPYNMLRDNVEKFVKEGKITLSEKVSK